MSKPLTPSTIRGIVNLATPAVLWILLWSQLAHQWMVDDQYGYGLFVPLLGAYLLYRQWENRPEPNPGGRIGAKSVFLVLGVAIVLLYPIKIIFEGNADWRLNLWVQGLIALGVTLAFIFYWGGWSWIRHFLPALIFWLFAIPWVSMIENPVVDNLMGVVAVWVVESANLLGIFAERTGNVIKLSSGSVSVEEACSGVRSLQSTLMASYFLGELMRFRWALRFFLIGAAAALAVFFNYARTLTLTIVTARQGGDVMEERWHDPAGYMVFAMSLGGLLMLVAILQKIRGDEHRAIDGEIPADISPPRLLPIAPLVTAMALMVTSIPAVKVWYATREQPSEFAGWEVNWQKAPGEVEFQEIQPRIEEILHYDKGELVRWDAPDRTTWLAYFLRWDEARSAQLGGIHNPEACLPFAGWKLIERGDDYVWKSPAGLELVFNTYEFRYEQTKMYVFYCQWDRTAFPYHRKPGRPVSDRLVDAWRGERKDGKIKLELFVYNARNIAQAQLELQRFLSQTIEPEPREAG